jgi:uncharacterized damage-inducible protein DinB
MPISQMLLPEFDKEMGTTRKLLERVPEEKFSWKPHERSMTFGRLSSHLAELPSWAARTIEVDSLDVAPPGQPPRVAADVASHKELLELFDGNVSAARKAIAGLPDEKAFTPWTLLKGGQKIFTIPRMAALRTFVFSHCIHHRGQLSVYLRLNNIHVPSIYGPSADENVF